MMVSASLSGIIVAGASRPAARGAERAVASRPDELDHGHDRRHFAELRNDACETLEPRALAAEDRLISGAQRSDRAAVEAASFQPDDVEAAEPRPLTDGRGERNDAGGDSGQPTDEGVGTDPAMLLDGGQPAEDRVLANLTMAAKRGVVDHDNVVGDDAVMGDMCADHQKALVADHRAGAATHRAAVHRRIFADDANAANRDRG